MYCIINVRSNDNHTFSFLFRPSACPHVQRVHVCVHASVMHNFVNITTQSFLPDCLCILWTALLLQQNCFWLIIHVPILWSWIFKQSTTFPCCDLCCCMHRLHRGPWLHYTCLVLQHTHTHTQSLQQSMYYHSVINFYYLNNKQFHYNNLSVQCC